MNEHASTSRRDAGWALLGSLRRLRRRRRVSRARRADRRPRAGGGDGGGRRRRRPRPGVPARRSARSWRGSRETSSAGRSASSALCFEASLFAGAYSTYGTFTHPGSLPAPQLLSLLSDMLIVPCFVLVADARAAALPDGPPADETLVDRRRRRGCLDRARDDLDGDPPRPGRRGCSVLGRESARDSRRRRRGRRARARRARFCSSSQPSGRSRPWSSAPAARMATSAGS